MCKFYLNKARKFLRLMKENKDGIFVNTSHQFVGKAELKDGTVLNIKLFPGYKPGGPEGVIPKNPNKYIVCPTNWLDRRMLPEAPWINGKHFPPDWINIDNYNGPPGTIV